MTSKEEHDMPNAENDVEFADFLQGQGELAGLLQELPQSQPSAELDAAILADAEKALAKPALSLSTSPMSMPTPTLTPITAANDNIGPIVNAGKTPSFLWRWKLPLGLAAGILFAMPLVLLQKQQASLTESNNESVHVATSTQKDRAATELPQLAKAEDMASPTVPVPVPAPARAAATAPVMTAKTAPLPTPDTDAAQKPVVTAMAESSIADMAQTKGKVTSNREDARQAPAQPHRVVAKQEPREPVVAQTAPPLVIAAAPTEAARVEVTGRTIRRLQSSESASPLQIISPREHSDEAAKTIIASKEEAAEPKKKFDENLVYPPAVSATKPLMARSAPEMSLTDKQSSPTSQAYAGAPPVSATAPAMTAPAAMPSPIIRLSPTDWLQMIDKLLKADRTKEALEEWKKFRLAYPDYAVSKTFQNQIDVLQK